MIKGYGNISECKILSVLSLVLHHTLSHTKDGYGCYNIVKLS